MMGKRPGHLSHALFLESVNEGLQKLLFMSLTFAPQIHPFPGNPKGF